MPARILLIRHGQTEWNRIDRFRGRADIDLNEEGKRQAEALAPRLASLSPVAIYSSPMKRTTQTAEPAARTIGIPLVPEPGLNDVDYGEWQGLAVEQARKNNPDLFAIWTDSPRLARFPGGEGLEEVRQRAAAAVAQLMLRHPDSPLAIVSHITVCRLLTLHFLNVSTDRFWSVMHDNCGISMFETRGDRFVATAINDTCHLRPEPPVT